MSAIELDPNFFLITNQMHQLFKFILLQNSTCFGHLLCPSSGVFYCTFGTGNFNAGLMTASKQSQPVIPYTHTAGSKLRCKTPTKHTTNISEPLPIISVNHSSILPDDGSHTI